MSESGDPMTFLPGRQVDCEDRERKTALIFDKMFTLSQMFWGKKSNGCLRSRTGTKVWQCRIRMQETDRGYQKISGRAMLLALVAAPRGST